MQLAELVDDIAATTGIRLVSGSGREVTGGDICSAFAVEDRRGQHWFLKTLAASAGDVLAAEAEGLTELGRAAAVRVPAVAGTGAVAGQAWLLLEYLPMVDGGTADGALGAKLALLHRSTGDAFGWHRDNYIGRTPQSNSPTADWPAFFANQRLRVQLELAAANGAPPELVADGETLARRVADWFDDYEPAASLVHGDLWGGNAGCMQDGEPVMFDPAVYFGDRETDLAMTRLFGGFGDDFYAAYAAEWPLDAGAAERVSLYNLYHVLNHFNLFGGGYLSQVRVLIDRLLHR